MNGRAAERRLRRAVARACYAIATLIDPDILTCGGDTWRRFREVARSTQNPSILELSGAGVGLRGALGLRGLHRYTRLGQVGSDAPLVGEAQERGALFKAESFDIVMSTSAFEHLAMPWKAVLGINAVMKTGGLLFIRSHQTFPLHEQPFDYWRFSDETWKALLNSATGFEIIHAGMAGPCRIAGCRPESWSVPRDQAAYLDSAVLARKSGPYAVHRLRWEVRPAEFLGAATAGR